MTRWTAADLSDQTGRTVIITGANSGIGLQAAKALARAGARVVLAVRSRERGERAAAGMAGRVEVRELDLTRLTSVRQFALGWTGPVDVLINNAGVMARPAARTEDGFELQLGTNHLGHFALTNLLLPHLSDRVVTVSSGAHRMGRIDLDDLNWERRDYDEWQAYGQSKLANLLFTLELQRRLDADHSPVRALAAHPGWAATNLQSGTSFRGRTGPWLDRLSKLGNALFAQTDERGALPLLYAASQDLPGASYVGPDGRFETRGHPTLVGRTTTASDSRLARDLWIRSEELTGVSYPAGQVAPT
ncbi:MAG: oxidoreductase [Actinomycetes bacterium]